MNKLPQASAAMHSFQSLAIHDTLALIGGKWTLTVLTALLTRKYHFLELSRELGISPRVLAKELKQLEQHQLVTRTVLATTPVTVEYDSTPHAQTLITLVKIMTEWGFHHHEAVVGKPRPGYPVPAVATRP